METERVGEGVATPEEQGDYHWFLPDQHSPLSFSSLSSITTGGRKQFFCSRSLFSTIVSLMLFWSRSYLFLFANSSLSATTYLVVDSTWSMLFFSKLPSHAKNDREICWFLDLYEQVGTLTEYGWPGNLWVCWSNVSSGLEHKPLTFNTVGATEDPHRSVLIVQTNCSSHITINTAMNGQFHWPLFNSREPRLVQLTWNKFTMAWMRMLMDTMQDEKKVLFFVFFLTLMLKCLVVFPIRRMR